MRQLDRKAAEWNVTLDEIHETQTSRLGFGWRDGARVVLKISKQIGDESHSGEVLHPQQPLPPPRPQLGTSHVSAEGARYESQGQARSASPLVNDTKRKIEA